MKSVCNTFKKYKLIISHPQLVLIQKVLESEARFVAALSDTFSVSEERQAEGQHLAEIAGQLRQVIAEPKT